MAYIDNSETAKELAEAIRGNANTNLPPKILNNSIQPVININPKDYRRCITRHTATAGGTIYTTPSDRDFFLVGASVSAGSQESTAAGSVSVQYTDEDGATQIFIKADTPATIATVELINTNNISLTYPVKVKRGTNITMPVTSCQIKSATIYGYVANP